MELSKILKDEAWLEGERQNKAVSLANPVIFDRSVEIWKKFYENNKKNYLALENTKEI
jgi:hypothetical protein